MPVSRSFFASLGWIIILCSGCTSYSPLLTSEQRESIMARDSLYKEIMSDRLQAIHGNGKMGALIVIPSLASKSSVIIVPGDSMYSAFQEIGNNALDNNSIATFVYRTPTAIGPEITTVGELRERVRVVHLLEKAATDNVAMQVAVLDATKLGVLNAKRQQSNAEALNAIEAAIGNISTQSRGSSDNLAEMKRSLEESLGAIRAQLADITAKLKSL